MQTHKRTTPVAPKWRQFVTQQNYLQQKKKKSVQCPTASPEQGQQPLLFANRALPFIKWVILWAGGEGFVIPSNRLLPDYAALPTLDKWAL